MDERFLNELIEKMIDTRAGWVAGETSLTRLTRDELKYMQGCLPEEGRSYKDLEEQSENNLREYIRYIIRYLPNKIDWRNVNSYNYVALIKNQGKCGSCTAFGAIATLESRIAVLTNCSFIPDLSEADIFFCQGGECTKGMQITTALNYCMNKGVVSEFCFPYKPEQMKCNPCLNHEIVKINGYHEISSINSMKQWLATKGPLLTCFSVYEDFYAYKNGVYSYVLGEFQGLHAISCIGYDDDKQAWICKNSWGTGWGENGYFMIGYGACGIDAIMYAIDSYSISEHMWPKEEPEDYMEFRESRPQVIRSAKAKGHYPVSSYHEAYWAFSVPVYLYRNGVIELKNIIDNVHMTGKFYWKRLNIKVQLTSYETEKLRYSDKIRITVNYDYKWDGLDMYDRPKLGKEESKCTIDFFPEELDKDAKLELSKKEAEYNYIEE